jgi:methyltransferase (TIGR00027 family)
VLREPVLRGSIAGAATCSRYAEDRLNESFSQYVVLGAGLDSFAWRRPDLLSSLRVFEVDHPATQDWKRERVAALNLPSSDRHVFAPVDFETATLRDGLTAAGFDWSAPTLYSWLGVTFYTPLDAVEATLREVAAGASGSEIVMGYIPTPPFPHELTAEFWDAFATDAATSDEGFQKVSIVSFFWGGDSTNPACAGGAPTPVQKNLAYASGSLLVDAAGSCIIQGATMTVQTPWTTTTSGPFGLSWDSTGKRLRTPVLAPSVFPAGSCRIGLIKNLNGKVSNPTSVCR